MQLMLDVFKHTHIREHESEVKAAIFWRDFLHNVFDNLTGV